MKHPLSKFSFCPVCGSSDFVVNNEKSKKCISCGFVYYFNSSAAVVAFIYNKEGELLICRRAKNPAKDTLDLPGGFVDENETAEEAICREVKEETNLTIDHVSYCFSLPNIYNYSDFEVHTLDLFFECEVSSFDELIVADDVSEAFFVSLDKVSLREFGLASIQKGMGMLLKSKSL